MTPPHPIPTLFPTRRSSDLLLALVIAVSAASPRNRPIQNALTDPFSDCSTFAPRIGSANSSRVGAIGPSVRSRVRSEEHTSELQSRPHLVCRLLLEKKILDG